MLQGHVQPVRLQRISDGTCAAPIGSATRPRDWVIGQNAAMRRIVEHIERVAAVQCTVLISGETGTGKEILAEMIHRSGCRASKPFLPVNCAALPTTLAESQLFGYEKGAFTGAAGSSLGIFRAAAGGIVFLDEVGELPLELQPKLLRVLQQRAVRPIGAFQPVPVDVQVIAATNRNLEVEVAEGRFREDLYYRLNMAELLVPPLRERREDLPELVEFFTRKFAEGYNLPIWSPDGETLRTFYEYPWPGNIRQLSNVIEQAYVLGGAPKLPKTDPENRAVPALPYLDLARLCDEAIRQALRASRGHKGRAARLLGVHANTLTRMIRRRAKAG